MASSRAFPERWSKGCQFSNRTLSSTPCWTDPSKVSSTPPTRNRQESRIGNEGAPINSRFDGKSTLLNVRFQNLDAAERLNRDEKKSDVDIPNYAIVSTVDITPAAPSITPWRIAAPAGATRKAGPTARLHRGARWEPPAAS